MPEQSRTPSKFAQVAPAVSGNTSPNIRHNAEPMAETLTNLKRDVLANPDLYPSLGDETKPDVLADSKNFPSAPSEKGGKGKSRSNGQEEESAKSAWNGKLPEAVKQPGEFHEADTVYVDEPAERAAGLERYKQQRKEKRMAMKSGPLRWLKGEVRETSIEKGFVYGVASCLVMVAQFLELLGLRQICGRLIEGINAFAAKVFDANFFQNAHAFGYQWWPYRLLARIFQNVGKRFHAQLGAGAGAKQE